MAEYGISTQHGCKIDQKLMIILGFHGSVCLDMYIYIYMHCSYRSQVAESGCKKCFDVNLWQLHRIPGQGVKDSLSGDSY